MTRQDIVTVSNFPSLQGVTGPLTDAQLRAEPVPVTISGGGSPSGGLTDAELRAAAVPVTGTFWQATQPVSGTVAISNFPVGGTGLTDVELRAAAVPVSIASMPSTAVTGPLTDAQLRAATVPVSGTVAVTGTFWQATQPVSAAALPLPAGAATSALQTQPGVDIGDVTVNNAAGAAAVNIQDGGNSITVDGTFWQATQPVSIASMPSTAVTGPLTDTQLRATAVPVSGTVAVTGTFWQATQPVSAAALPLPAGAATSALQTSLNALLPAALVGARLDINNGAWLGSTAPTVGQKTAANSVPVVLASDQTTINVAMAAAAALFKGQASTFRTPGRAGTAGQKILSIHNATGSAVVVTVNRIWVDLMMTVVKVVTVAPPMVRVWKVTVLPTNGTALTKNKIGGSAVSNASVTVLGDASADGSGSGTTLTATLPAGTIIEQMFAPRIITGAGCEMADRMEFLLDFPVVLNALEGLVVFLDYTLATQNPVTDMWLAGVNWSEN